MRVVQLITQGRGGPVDHAVDVAVELSRLGHDSHVVGPPGSYRDRLVGTGVRVHRAGMAGKADVAGARETARTVRRLRPDVLHAQDRRAGLVSRTLLRGQPGVYTLHGVPDSLAHLVPGNLAVAPPARSDTFGNLTVERMLARSSRFRVVAPCEALAAYARQQVGIPAERVRAVHNGVPQRWAVEAAPEHRDGSVTAVWVGVMQPVKRLPQLVSAVAGVPGLRLVLVGDGPERPLVEAAVRAHDLGRRVHLVGFQPDPQPFLRMADLAVLPSAAEACPMALLQAMASGLPVVASRAGGIPEIVRDGVDGVLVRTGDDHELTKALRALSTDADHRRRLGGNARERIRDGFTVEHCVRGLLEVYGEVSR